MGTFIWMIVMRSLLTFWSLSFRIKLLQGMPENYLFETWPDVVPLESPFWSIFIWPSSLASSKHYETDSNLELMTHIWKNNLPTLRDFFKKIWYVCLFACLSVPNVYTYNHTCNQNMSKPIWYAYYISQFNIIVINKYSASHIHLVMNTWSSYISYPQQHIHLIETSPTPFFRVFRHLEESLNHQAMTHQNAGLPWSCLIVLSTKKILHKYLVKSQTNIHLRCLDTVKPNPQPMSSSKLVFATKNACKKKTNDSRRGWKKSHLEWWKESKHVTLNKSKHQLKWANFIYKKSISTKCLKRQTWLHQIFTVV